MCRKKTEIDIRDKVQVEDLLRRLLKELESSSELLRHANALSEQALSMPQTEKVNEAEKQLIDLLAQLNNIPNQTQKINEFWPQLSDSHGNHIMYDLRSKFHNMYVSEVGDLRLYLQLIKSPTDGVINSVSSKQLKRSKILLARSVYKYARTMVKLANYYRISRNKLYVN